MHSHPTDPPEEEVFEATRERSHRTVAGIEVVEYDQTESEQDQAASATQDEGAAPDSVEPSDDGRLDWVKQECDRLSARLARAREELENQKRDHLDRTRKHLTRIYALEAEVREKSTTIDRLTASYEALQERLEEGAEQGLGVAIGEIERHHSDTDIVSSLKERLDERGRALKVAREEVGALHREREDMARALRERTRQVAQLLEQVTQAEVQSGFGMDFRSSIKRLFQRFPAVATGNDTAEAWDFEFAGISTVALDSPGSGAGRSAGTHTQAVGATDFAPLHDSVVGVPTAPDTGLKRFLLPTNPGLGAVFELIGPRSYVGRSIASDIRITHPTISRLHGVLYCIGGATIVEDARSTNGIYVNGRRVDQSVLKDGDVLAFGSVEFSFRVATSEA